MNIYLALFAILVFVVIITPVFLKRVPLTERAKLHEVKVACDYVAFTGEDIQIDIKINLTTNGRVLKYNGFEEECVSNVSLVSGIVRVRRVRDHLGD